MEDMRTPIRMAGVKADEGIGGLCLQGDDKYLVEHFA